MKLTLEDLTRDELLELAKRQLFRPRQADLLELRHTSLTNKATELEQKELVARSATLAASSMLLKVKFGTREHNAAERAYLDAKDNAGKAERAAKRARKAEQASWKALTEAWGAERR